MLKEKVKKCIESYQENLITELENEFKNEFRCGKRSRSVHQVQ